MDDVIIKLPSKCLAYEGVNPDDVKIRTMKGSDEKLIAESNPNNFDKRSIVLLGRVLKGVKPEDVTLGDRLFVLIWETINSYSKMYPLSLMCPLCFKNIDIEVDLSKLEKKELPDDFKQPYELKLSETTVNLRLLTLKDEAKCSEEEAAGRDSWLYRLALTLVDDRDIMQRVEFLENLSTRDLGLIRAFHEKFVHGLDMKYEYDCPKCEGRADLQVPFRLEMLLPAGSVVARSHGIKI